MMGTLPFGRRKYKAGRSLLLGLLRSATGDRKTSTRLSRRFTFEVMARYLLVCFACVFMFILVAATSVHFRDDGESLSQRLAASVREAYEIHRTSQQTDKTAANSTDSPNTSRSDVLSKKLPRFLFDFHDYGELGYRSEFYWLIPLIMVIGIGALLLPLLSVFTTALVSSGAITLTAGRKKREAERIFASMQPNALSDTMMSLLTQVEKAFEKFGQDINSKYEKKD